MSTVKRTQKRRRQAREARFDFLLTKILLIKNWEKHTTDKLLRMINENDSHSNIMNLAAAIRRFRATKLLVTPTDLHVEEFVSRNSQ